MAREVGVYTALAEGPNSSQLPVTQVAGNPTPSSHLLEHWLYSHNHTRMCVHTHNLVIINTKTTKLKRKGLEQIATGKNHLLYKE